jgi:hypothetical protein
VEPGQHKNWSAHQRTGSAGLIAKNKPCFAPIQLLAWWVIAAATSRFTASRTWAVCQTVTHNESPKIRFERAVCKLAALFAQDRNSESVLMGGSFDENSDNCNFDAFTMHRCIK